MKLNLIKSLFVSLFVFSTSQAYALIDASVMVGPRTSTFTTSGTDTDVGGMDYVISAHVAPFPIPMVSIGLGGALTATTWDETDFSANHTEAASLNFALEAMVSVSVPFLATPYAKLGYNLSDKLVYAAEDDSTGTNIKTAGTMTGTGTTFAVGAKFSILPFISAMLEYSLYNGELTEDDLEVGGVTVTGSDVTTDVASSSFLLGVEVDIGL